MTVSPGWIHIGDSEDGQQLFMGAWCFPCSLGVPPFRSENVPAAYCAHQDDPASPTLLCVDHTARWRVTADPPIVYLHALDVPCPDRVRQLQGMHTPEVP